MLIFKNSFRKIWKSIGRFLSLILIVILGTSFFAGVRETASDMIKTLDNYYDETNLYDFKIVSTMGLTDDDIKSLEDIKGIKEVEGSYSFDTLIDGNAVKVSAFAAQLGDNLLLIAFRLCDNGVGLSLGLTDGSDAESISLGNVCIAGRILILIIILVK